MKRAVMAALIVSCACSRSAPPSARPVPRAPVVSAQSFERFEDSEEVMDPVRELSRHPATEEGLRDLTLELCRAAMAHDAARVRELDAALALDRTRLELAFTFEGARRLGDLLLPLADARRAALEGRLAGLREPVRVSVVAARGAEITDTGTRGLDPRMASLRALLRPAVTYYRVEVHGAGSGAPVVFEPLAYLGGRWTWLAEPWTVLLPVETGTVGSATRTR